MEAQGRCSLPYAVIAANNARFLSNQTTKGQYTAKSASKNTEGIEAHQWTEVPKVHLQKQKVRKVAGKKNKKPLIKGMKIVTKQELVNIFRNPSFFIFLFL